MSKPSRKNDAPCRRGQLVGGRYVVGDVLGAGGMGVVYAAVQQSLERTVALKLPRSDLVNDPTVRRRLRCEALAGSRINHHNIVRVIDYGIDHEVPFVVMEHVVGPRLSDLLADLGPMPVATAVDLVRQIVAGLTEAHAQGVVHGDVKCDNVLVETVRDGTHTPRLIDFGIARFIDEPDPDAGQPVITGTPEYLAPEVIRGEPVGFAADVYAVGIMLYELLAGATPFAGGSSTEVMSRRLDDDAVPIRIRRPDVELPLDLEALMMRTLARNPVDRYADATALERALEELGHVTAPIPKSDAGRHELGRALLGREPDDIIVACLGVVRTLVDDHRLSSAISELEAGIVLVEKLSTTSPVWRLRLMLAALYDGVGDRNRARLEASNAQVNARRCSSSTGCGRAADLLSRLSRRRSRTRAPAW